MKRDEMIANLEEALEYLWGDPMGAVHPLAHTIEALLETTKFVLDEPDFNKWDCTACGWSLQLMCDDPQEHQFSFCPGCGKPIDYGEGGQNE